MGLLARIGALYDLVPGPGDDWFRYAVVTPAFRFTNFVHEVTTAERLLLVPIKNDYDLTNVQRFLVALSKVGRLSGTCSATSPTS